MYIYLDLALRHRQSFVVGEISLVLRFGGADNAFPGW
jgi:hypothetical protein